MWRDDQVLCIWIRNREDLGTLTRNNKSPNYSVLRATRAEVSHFNPHRHGGFFPSTSASPTRTALLCAPCSVHDVVFLLLVRLPSSAVEFNKPRGPWLEWLSHITATQPQLRQTDASRAIHRESSLRPDEPCANVHVPLARPSQAKGLPGDSQFLTSRTSPQTLEGYQVLLSTQPTTTRAQQRIEKYASCN